MGYSTGDGVANPARPTGLNSKRTQLEDFTVRCPADGTHHVTQFSQSRVDNLDTSMRAGARGPTTLDDPVARERIQHFDHESIPARVVHARGAGAHGVFKLHTSLSDVTCAKVLTETGVEVPTFTRFSTVLGSSGAAETAREVRGFATKFYTDQGNWDIVGNNIPVFFVQDGVKFVDLIHAGKPDPQIGLPQAQTAHDSMWDFLSLMPESSHMIMWMLSDHTIPRSYRMISGYGVNTFVLVSADGKRTFVKFHWRPHQGIHGLVWDEALKLGGQDPDFLRRDLADAIEAGAGPKYELGVQLVPEENENDFDFDLLDCTKLIPEELVPVKWVGTLHLNANPTNYFAETEQVAFCTSNVVPGIDFSNDPMLAWRNFSYADTQLSRLGGPNYNQIPINRSRCPFISTARDGQGNQRIPAGPHYYPNRFSLPTAGVENGANFATSEADIKVPAGGDVITYGKFPVEGIRAKQRPPKFAETVNQAQLFYNSLSDVEKTHVVAAAQFELGRVDDRGIQERMIKRFSEVDYDFAVQVSEGFGIEVSKPSQPNHGKTTDGSNPFSMLSKNNVFPSSGRKIAIFVLDGFDSLQVTGLRAGLEGLGNIVHLIGARKGPAYPRGVKVGSSPETSGVQSTHFTIESCRSTYFDALYFPTGDEAYAKSLEQGRVIHFLREAFGHFKTIGACGVAVPWLAHTCLPGSLDIDADASKSWSVKNGVVIGRDISDSESATWKKLVSGGSTASYGLAFTEALSAHRHWDRDISKVAF